ncbi:Tll1452 protein [Candidatus Moduliflexus flocculans]|uniref:Tll1452 protein n=1 Tax=Candidatus Moduliflexus flocculans TaxID=1499966 RepID=A0A0S6VVK2_9BACT|nr:Tll1452 protein [Candidatus Moduliflexus flocculans]
MDERFDIVFEGHIKEHASLPDVKRKLAALFKLDEARVEQLFQRVPVVIKRNLTRAEAVKYDRVFEQTGAESRIVPASQTASKPISTFATPPTVARQRLMVCPKCGAEQAEGRIDCLRCGIVFTRFQHTDKEPRERIEPLQSRLEQNAPDAERDESEQVDEVEELFVQSIEREGWLSFGIGAVITIIVFFLPFLNFIFSYMKVLVHEFGHALASWLFAYPSIPAFDFMYGGGVALTDERQPALFLVIYGGLALLFYLFRRNALALVLLGVFTVLYSACAFTEAHQVVILFMGHGSELLFAGLFLYRALSGSGVIVVVERPLYAFLGIFIMALDLQFAFQLMSDYGYRVDYEEAKGGGHWMDFSRIAEEFLHVDLTVVAGFFFFCCILTPLCAFMFFRYKPMIFRALARVLRTEPET